MVLNTHWSVLHSYSFLKWNGFSLIHRMLCHWWSVAMSKSWLKTSKVLCCNPTFCLNEKHRREMLICKIFTGFNKCLAIILKSRNTDLIFRSVLCLRWYCHTIFHVCWLTNFVSGVLFKNKIWKWFLYNRVKELLCRSVRNSWDMNEFRLWWRAHDDAEEDMNLRALKEETGRL